MKKSELAEIQENTKPCIALKEFCDMEQLYMLLDNWSKSTGMSAVIVDAEGTPTSDNFGMTEFCSMIHANENGRKSCVSIWKENNDGIYVCPVGFCDFSIPITLPDGQILGRVLAGQALSMEQDEENVFRRTIGLGIDSIQARDVLSRVHKKTQTEMEGAYKLLREMLRFFVEKNYSIWKTNNELKNAPARQDRILSQITQIMYSYNLTVDLSTGTYTLITGTGMERTVEEYKKHDRQTDLKLYQDSIIHPDYIGRFNELIDFEDARNDPAINGFRGSLEYPVLYPGDEEYEWHEINVFISTNEDGVAVANILGRDITEAHEQQVAKERELKAAAAKDQILSDITKTLYSYNATVNLNTGKYSLIVGTGMEEIIRHFSRTDDYEMACEYLLEKALPEYLEEMNRRFSLKSLREQQNLRGHIGQMEYAAATENGIGWYEVNAFMGVDEDGNPTANILGRDITESHEALERRENELKAMMAKDQILSNITKTLYSYNLTLNLITGKYSLILGTGMEDFVKIFEATDDYEAAYQQKIQYVRSDYIEAFGVFSSLSALRNRMDETGYIGNLEYAVEAEKGIEWHEINIFLGTDENGDPIANILGRDITEAHEQQEIKERELRVSAARDQLLSSVTKMLYSYNMTINVDTGNYTLITGTGLKAAVDFLLAHERYEDAYQAFYECVVPEQRQQVVELLSLVNYRSRKDNRISHLGSMDFLVQMTYGLEWHEINVFAGFDEDGEAIINILGRDVTEAHDKADTKAQLEIANAASAAKSAFLFNMSHDIRTPMNAIIGFTELLEKHLDDPELARNYVKKIQTSNEFLLSLINNVLEMARIESGKETLDETSANAHSFIDSLYALFDPQMKEKGITFSSSTQVTHPDVIVDETKLREIYLNILSNALKYTPVGGSVTMVLTEIPSERPGYVMYRTVIEDTGIGMAEEFLPHIFEEFTRERSSTESRVSGTGLGMPIVKKLVDLMQGTIEVESQIGKGTRFTVTLPHRITEETDHCRPTEKAKDYQTDCFVGKRILLAEDNELNAEIAITILEEAGFFVERAEDGVICVDMLEKADPGYYDLILMDIQMPNMDGYKATQTIRKFADQKKAGITIIAMTANAFEEDRRNAFCAGMNGHIAKPMRVEQLLSALAESLK